jgi:4-amino-4-deoxy-L-arabinose transferase-like glycosyltransferase
MTPERAWLPILIIAGLTCAIRGRQRKLPRWEPLPRPRIDARTVSLLIPLCAIAFCIVAMVIHALALPLYEWDAFSIWFLKAKILLHQPLLPTPAYFHDPAMSYSHRDYPLGQPMFIAGLWGIAGRANDHSARVALLLPYIGMACLFFAEARRRTALGTAGWLTAIFACAPAITFWAPSGNADVMLAAFYLAHLIYLVRWLESRAAREIAAAGFFACCMAFTKHEGVPLVLISGVLAAAVVAFKERRLSRSLLIYPAVFVMLIPWLAWSWNLPASNERYAPRLTPAVVMENLASVGPGLRLIGTELVRFQSWGLLVPLLALVTLLTAQRLRRLAVLGLWLAAAAHLAMYLMAWIVAEPLMKQMMPGVMNRLVLHVMPAIALLIVVHWPSQCPAVAPSAAATRETD